MDNRQRADAVVRVLNAGRYLREGWSPVEVTTMVVAILEACDAVESEHVNPSRVG